MAKNITPEQIQAELAKNITKHECAKNLGIDDTTFRKKCKKFGIKYEKLNARRGKILPQSHPEVDKDWLIKNWVNTPKSMEQLSIEFNIPSGLLEARRAKYNVKKIYKYQVDTTILFNIKDPNICYLAGLIATDGYIVKDLDAFELSLTGDDELVLLKAINTYLKSTAPIRQYGKSYRLRITCKGVQEFFESEFNIKQENKTFSVGIPSTFYSESCAAAYVRGCLDGDGCIRKDGNGFGLLTGSIYLIEGLHNIIKEYLDLDFKINYQKRKDKKYPYIGTTDLKARKVLKWCYDTDGLCLKRKKLRALSYKEKNIYTV